ncbi:hypothetical protein CMI37_18435 [Candidatus Pacearchaeota archaeon]|nr:hypothetical protein [Candidatus Pacearchaeota archaeon]|tara:strand:- start:96 stop:467 length:372 start_codon:yes stop_codon:yes gene_type:complete
MLLDSYAWIEFFQGSERGEKVWNILNSIECCTSIVSISEIIEWCLRNNIDYKDRISRIKKMSKILSLDEQIVLLAGRINFYNKKKIKNWGMLDSLIYATARLYGLKVLTGDKHFFGLEDVEML